MPFKLKKSKKVKRDIKLCTRAGFDVKLDEIFDTLEEEPFRPTQGFERLTGNLNGLCSREINRGNRVLYAVFENTEGAKDDDGNLYDGIVYIFRAWGHNYKKPAKPNP